MCLLPGLVPVNEKWLKICPHFVSKRICVPELIGISEILGGEYQVVGGCGDLFKVVSNSSVIVKTCGHFDLVNEIFERFIHIVRGGYVGGIIL